MKQITLLSIAVLAFGLHSSAQNKHTEPLNGTMVSEATTKQFAKDFPGQKAIESERKHDYERIIFRQNGEHATAYYNAHSRLVGTIVDKLFDELPQQAQDFITVKYRDYTPEAVVFYDDNEDEPGGLVLASQDFDDWDYYFVKLKHKGDNKEVMLKVDLGGHVSVFNQHTH